MKKSILDMLVAVVVVVVLAGSSFGQELALGCRPKEPPKPKLIIGDEIVWNMISIQFRVGVVNLVQKRGDTTGVPIENVKINSPRVRALCDSLGAVMIEQTFKGKTPADTLSISRTGEIVRVEDLSQCFAIIFGDSIDVAIVVKLFNSLPEVKNAEPVGIIHKDTKVEPNDEHFQNGDQWGLNGNYGINAPAAWDSSKGDGIIIAIIDEGVDRIHDEFLTKIYGGEEGYYDEHGTEVAGVAAAATDNFIGIAGVAWNSLIMPMNHGPGGNALRAAEDIETAVDDGADVLNCSFFVNMDYVRLKQACRYAYQNNVVVVAGAGNDDYPIPYDAWPAAYDSFTIAVGAITQYGERPWWSNYGSWLDVMAPGENIWTTEPLDDYDAVDGTSLSAAFVSGIAALIRSAHPSFSADKVKWKICSSAIDMGEEGWDEFTGHGRVYAPAAVGIKEQETQTSTPLVFSLSQNYPNPFNATTAIDYALPEPSQVELEIYNITGQKVAALIDRKENTGYHTARWDAKTIPSGIYFYRLQTEEFVETRKMILLR